MNMLILENATLLACARCEARLNTRIAIALVGKPLAVIVVAGNPVAGIPVAGIPVPGNPVPDTSVPVSSANAPSAVTVSALRAQTPGSWLYTDVVARSHIATLPIGRLHRVVQIHKAIGVTRPLMHWARAS
ncbi:MAG: hypothetical protein CMK72_03550 [Pseudomonadaceae bacterium]|nr:hypothetical protein [Pseudomonadaceae bacterium]HCP55422.1 hypothetical protein [Pseudomonas sp.]|tara:strand:+ start:748 stop:1140 length:393 start_codon:yes stop_codon:yes gene_type:complete